MTERLTGGPSKEPEKPKTPSQDVADSSKAKHQAWLKQLGTSPPDDKARTRPLAPPGSIDTHSHDLDDEDDVREINRMMAGFMRSVGHVSRQAEKMDDNEERRKQRRRSLPRNKDKTSMEKTSNEPS